MAFTLGSILSGAGKVLGGVIKATPLGQAISTLGEVVHSDTKLGQIVRTPIAPLAGIPMPVLKSGGGVMPSGAAPPSLPAISGGIPNAPGTSVTAPRPTDVRGADPSTYSTTKHIGQRGHYTRTGRFIRTNAKGKAIRRMNPMNVHAARRAVRRIKSGDKLFRKIFRILHHHKPATAVKRGKR